MDLSAYSLQKLNREKRERQPNWTESEKQLLLSLTRIHRSVLENKGSDTMTIKRKSEVWDEIALRMKAAGFNRSKERLKQQLGRIRAAEAKRIKDIMEKNLPKEQIEISNDSNNHAITYNPHCNGNQIDFSSNNSISLPERLQLQECQYIKSEEAASINEKYCSEQELLINSSTSIKPSTMNCAIISASKDNSDNSKTLTNIHFKLQKVQSLAAANHNADKELAAGCNNEDVTSTIACSSNTKATGFQSNQITDSGNDENAACSFSASKTQTQKSNKHRLRGLRPKRMRISITREQSLRQLYMYRAAVERERLRSLRIQQKRDRILYRKDIEIQNLKLQILRNLTNQNRDASGINL